MSAVLVVTKDKKQIAKVALSPGLFIIGRSEKCNLPIDEPLASRQHAEISIQGKRHVIRDLGSRNGTLVAGQKLAGTRELRDGDEIEIGATRLKFLCEEADADDEGETRAMSPEDLEKKAPGQVVVEKKDRGNLEVRLRVTDGPLAGGVFKNWDGPLAIGRSLDNHVVLVDDAVSSRHAKIVQEGEHYFILDTDSANGTFLNGVKVQRSELANGSKIKVGTSTLIFDLTDLRAQRRNLNIALACFVVCAGVVLAVKLWPDPAGAHIQSALRLEAAGNYTQALEEFHLATTLAPNRAQATEGYSRVKSEIDAAAMLKSAETAAAAEEYDKALDLVFRVQRTFKDNARAAELEAVIKSIQEARVALEHENWDVAVKRLQKAQETYPNSKLIALQLEQAQKEMAAQQNLTQAKAAFQFEQWDKARQLLAMIPAASVYANEAREYSDKITRQEKTSASLNNAKSIYNQGQLMPALDEIERGLKITPDSAALADLQKRVRAMVPLADPLNKAASLGQADPVDDLLAARKACADVLQTENDPLNSMVATAKDVDSRVAQWLQTLSQSFTEKGRDLLKSGNRKEAMNLFVQAIKANPENQIATQEGNKLRKDIIKECEDLYGTARRYQELGLTDKVRENFNRILQIDLPDDKWYKLAGEELSRLK
jgi:pSer/pThr/pTyr-binding forkhead associated (FHA) protein